MCPAEVTPNAFGLCLRATADLPQGTVVARFDGPVVPFAHVPDHEIVYVLAVGDDRYLIPKTPARYINHSCAPNCRLTATREVITGRRITPGEELTIAYNVVDRAQYLGHPGWYRRDERWTFRCQCGAESCAGLIDRYTFRGESSAGGVVRR